MTKEEIEEAINKALNDNKKEENKVNSENKNNLEYNASEYNDINENIKENTNQKNEKSQENKTIEELQKKIDDLTETIKRVQADFINYKNRAEKEKLYCIEYGNADLIKRLLPVLDSFDLALQNAVDFEKFKKGIEMVYAQLLDVLEHEGLKKIDANGKFDPYKHEVLLKSESDKEEDEILQELQKGYMLKDKVLRHTKVKVSSGKKQK
ncbi:MAG: nucleotide exchange factor GrpE [Candidatus Woesearchaeota archaeon]